MPESDDEVATADERDELAAKSKPGGLASRNDLGFLTRQISSRIIRGMVSPTRLRTRRRLREWRRRLRRGAHEVHYFHEVADPYSQLAAQALSELADRYAISIVPHLCAPDRGPNIPEPELLGALARRDCSAIAPHYGLTFADTGRAPSPEAMAQVEAALSATLRDQPDRFAARASELGASLWSGEDETLQRRLSETPVDSPDVTRATRRQGSELRSRWKHYSGAMFYYEGEWYWGVDRLHHLEQRLLALGAGRSSARSGGPIRFARPAIDASPVSHPDELTLEIFPSLRSPYTAISLEPAIRLAERTGIKVLLRPVLPMVMRGVPATFAKGLYIMTDTAREAAILDMPFGRILDPIGEPVRRAYSLWPWAVREGHGADLLTHFLRAAFSEGVDTSREAGLRLVVERAGLSWQEAQRHLGDPAWEEELEANRLAMVHELGQWGVPSFRLRGPDGEPELCSWGQDRLWLVAREIQRRGAGES